MVFNALERIRQTRGVEININLELTKNEKNVFAVFLACYVDGSFFYRAR